MLAIMITVAHHRSGVRFSIIVQLLSLNYLTLLKINLPIPSLEKSDVVRSDNRFGKSNPGISATMKCF
jgi:hypothetical protein